MREKYNLKLLTIFLLELKQLIYSASKQQLFDKIKQIFA